MIIKGKINPAVGHLLHIGECLTEASLLRCRGAVPATITLSVEKEDEILSNCGTGHELHLVSVHA